MELSSTAGGLAAALADILEPSGEASPEKFNVLIASGEGVFPEHAVTAVVGDELTIFVSLGSDPETQAVTPPVVGGTRGDTSDDDAGPPELVVTVNFNLDVSGDSGLLDDKEVATVVLAVVVTILNNPEAVVVATEVVG